MLRQVEKTKQFKADKIEKARFTNVNEHFEIEVQRGNAKLFSTYLKQKSSSDKSEKLLYIYCIRYIITFI